MYVFLIQIFWMLAYHLEATEEKIKELIEVEQNFIM
jgi:hypothetical protein